MQSIGEKPQLSIEWKRFTIIFAGGFSRDSLPRFDGKKSKFKVLTTQ